MAGARRSGLTGALRGLAWLVLSSIVVLTVLVASVWIWTGSDDSLASSLTRAARHLPDGQTLEAEDVKGSLRKGGHIGLLRWRGNGLMVEARDIDLGWQPFALIGGAASRKLTLDTLAIRQLIIDDQRTPTPAKPVDSFLLPLQVDASFAVENLQWRGPAPLAVTNLKGRYQYDGTTHSLAMQNAGFAAGKYSAEATLLAQAPMTLDARVRGEVQAPIPGGGKPLPLQVVASAHGPLAGVSATLDVRASVQPGSGTTAPPSSTQAMRATASALIMPWAVQPVVQGGAVFNKLDLAVLWPQAPATSLDGSVTLAPVAGRTQQWLAQGNVHNAASGPWDKHRLPVQSAQGRVLWSQGAWDVESLKAVVADGQVQAQGRLQMTAASTSASVSTASAQLTGWQFAAQLQGVNPAGLHTQLAAAPLDGKLEAKATGQAVDFTADLKPSGRQPAGSKLQGLRLKEGIAKGRWAAGKLSLQTLRVQTADALLEGRQVEVQIATRASSGQVDFTLPGAQGSVQGRISAADGAGDFRLRVSDAALATRWLAQLPGMPALKAAIQGKGEAAGKWQGGWQNEGRNLNVQATLDVPQLNIRSAGQSEAQATLVRELKADVKGQLAALTLDLNGRIETGTQRIRLQTTGTGGRTATGGWQGRVDRALLEMQDSFRPGVWSVRLQSPLTLAWQGSALQTGPGEASLSGPAAGTATIAWQPVNWQNANGRTLLTTRGQLRGLPLGWLELLGNTQLANLGLSGSMMFDGDWDIQAGDSFRLQAGLQRRSGDLRVQADTDVTGAGVRDVTGAVTGVQINAGVREASLRITSDGDNLRAALRWDSENAGQATAEIGTRVTRGAEGWQWPDDAPLSGSIRASLPRVGVWSVLAPPGWRMRGTLELDAALAGTRHAPNWTGSLRADDLALRSVVEGIEFSGGKLRATLNGLRLGIDEFSLRGAPSGNAGTATSVSSANNSGGLLTVSGFVAWQPGDKPGASMVNKVRMELSARAESLRVSARADRRLVVSGALQARLVETRVELRGNLKADQALIILPDETTPTLGSDVVVKSSVPRAGPQAGATPDGGIRILPDVAIKLDLGNDFRVQGRGVSTRLAGTVDLHTTVGATAAPRLTGEVRAVAGTYRAYGQYLNIEEGVLRFTGPLDNPSLDILAIRPNLSQRVGVQINGTALAPRVRLYASPDLPDAEKLAWLVLGRSAAAGGAESAVLQQAAIALLGSRSGNSGGIAQAFGLDEISFRGSATASDGTTSSAAFTLGKRLSRDFYVAYERSMAGTMGTFYIFYDLSKRFTLRAQTGEQSAVDLIFTLPYE